MYTFDTSHFKEGFCATSSPDTTRIAFRSGGRDTSPGATNVVPSLPVGSIPGLKAPGEYIFESTESVVTNLVNESLMQIGPTN